MNCWYMGKIRGAFWGGPLIRITLLGVVFWVPRFWETTIYIYIHISSPNTKP